jgi:cyanophycin synthetase
MLEAALTAHGIGTDRVEVIVDEQDAIEAALRKAQPGDLVLVFADALARGWKQITQFKPDSTSPNLVSPKTPAPQTIAPDVIELADDVVPPPAPAPVPLSNTRDFPVFPVKPPAPASAGGAGDGATIVRDDRGVFLAREAND